MSGSIRMRTLGESGLQVSALAPGFIALAYDASHYGESGGEPRLYEVPGDRVEDIRCGVDFSSSHPTPGTSARRPSPGPVKTKELYVVEGATHIDLYDGPEYVPQVVSRLAAFHAEHL
jgi:fermentation-respiration switch protein FrsA (DUF1100 family)